MLKLKNTIVVAVLLMLSSGCKKEKSRICELYSSEVAYSVGTIESFVSVPFRVTYSYSFVANGQTFEGNEKAYGVGQKNETLIGKQFIVIYALGDESNNDLNINFAIESEQDFEDFKSKFSSGPPAPDFPNNCR